MIDLGISVVDLSDEEKEGLEATMAGYHRLFQEAAMQILGSDNPASVKRVRTQHSLPADVANAIGAINAIAPVVLAGYIRTVFGLIHSYHLITAKQCSGLEVEDFVQEAKVAIYDAMFTFDGSKCFTTYIYGCVKRHLAQVQHREIKAGAMTNHVNRLARKRSQGSGRKNERVNRKMRDFLDKVESHCQPKVIEDEENSGWDLGDDGPGPSSWDTEFEDTEHDECVARLQLAAIAEAPLTQLERDIITAYMRGEQRGVVQMRTYNPSTGKPYSRQGILNAYNTAVAKIRLTYASLLRDVAA